MGVGESGVETGGAEMATVATREKRTSGDSLW